MSKESELLVSEGGNPCWERLSAVIRWTGKSTNSFALNIGLPRAENLYQIKKGNNGISKKLAHRVVERYPEINELWLLSGSGQMFGATSCPPNHIPFYRVDVERFAGKFNGLAIDERIAFPTLSEAEFAMLYLGGAMCHKIPAGSIVFMQEVDPQYIIPSHEYLILTDSVSMLRTVRTTPDGDCWRMEADDKERYDEILIPKNQIKSAWKVVAKVIC